MPPISVPGLSACDATATVRSHLRRLHEEDMARACRLVCGDKAHHRGNSKRAISTGPSKTQTRFQDRLLIARPRKSRVRRMAPSSAEIHPDPVGLPATSRQIRREEILACAQHRTNIRIRKPQQLHARRARIDFDEGILIERATVQPGLEGRISARHHKALSAKATTKNDVLQVVISQP